MLVGIMQLKNSKPTRCKGKGFRNQDYLKEHRLIPSEIKESYIVTCAKDAAISKTSTYIREIQSPFVSESLRGGKVI